MAMTLLERIHIDRKARLQRIEAAAWKPRIVQPEPVIEAPPPPEPPPPPPKSRMEQLLESLLAAPKVPLPESYPKVSKIQQITAAYYNESIFEVLSDRRYGNLPRVRQIAMYLCTKFTPLSLAAIGRKFGRDHTTARHGILKIAALCESDPTMFIEIEELKQLIGNMRQA